MTDENIINQIPKNILEILNKKLNVYNLRPSQVKSIEKGLFKNENNQLICTPTGSGKTLVAEMAILDTILNKKKKAIYIVPLKALASEKYKEFVKNYGDLFKIRISIGELQTEKYNYDYDLLFVTSEKLDSLIRFDKKIINDLGLIIADEIHLLNDEKRGPTLEILLSIFKTKYDKVRIIALSATVGNSKEIAEWLEADLIEDDWRPVELSHCILVGNNLYRYK
jgi:helicase